MTKVCICCVLHIARLIRSVWSFAIFVIVLLLSILVFPPAFFFLLQRKIDVLQY